MNDKFKIQRREDLQPLERAVSDTLDEYLVRLHGVFTPWSHPYEFMEFLEKRGYTVIKFYEERE